MSIPYTLNFPQPTSTRSKCQTVWLQNCQSVAAMWAKNHVPLNAQAYAGYHNIVAFEAQSSTPTPVLGYNRLFSSESALNIQTSGSPSALQPITPVQIRAGSYFYLPPSSPDEGTALSVVIVTQPILGTPLQVITLAISPITNLGGIVTQSYNIPYLQLSGTVTFSSLVFAGSSTMPTTSNTGAPIWGMPQYNTVFSGTPSLATVGAYLSSVVVYVDNQAMQNASPGKKWTVTVVGVV